MSKFMNVIDNEYQSCMESIIDHQYLKLQSLMFESLVLNESLEIYPVYEGEFFDRVKKVASDIWDKIIEFFNTVANTIGGWISQLKGLFNKRKNEEAKAKNTSDDNKEGAKPEGEKKYLQKITLTIEKGHINIFSEESYFKQFIDEVIEFIKNIHTTAENMYREPEKVTDEDINNLKLKSRRVTKIDGRVAENITMEITMENAETYMGKLQKIKGEIEQASSKVRALKNMSKDSYSKAVKKGKDAEVVANKISAIITNVANQLPMTLNDVKTTTNTFIKQLRTFLTPKSE